MKRPKSWSYTAITANAEKRIRSFMDDASRKEDREEQRLLRSFAWGVWWGWATLTSGWQKDGDSDRLEALTRG